MSDYGKIKVCIINGYPEPNRKVLADSGVAGADDLYIWALERNYPGIRIETLMVADLHVDPYSLDLESYDAFIWTGSNLTIFHDDERVKRQIRFSQKLYELGRPQYGSCWAVQMAAVAAGGKCEVNPKGREWCLARDIRLTEEGKKHPFYKGKPEKFDAFIMHLDHVVEIPDGATILATNEHTPIHSLAVEHGNGVFWAQQYHPEYTLYEMSRLVFCRSEKIIKEGHVPDKEYLLGMVADLEAISKAPDAPENKSKREKWNVGDDIVSDAIRETEIRNFFDNLVFKGKDL